MEDEIIFFTTVCHRPDLLSLQIQLVRKLIPQVTRYLVFNAPTKRLDALEIMAETERVCKQYDVEYFPMDKCNRDNFKKDSFRYVKSIHSGYMFYMESDVLPYKPITLGEGAFARFQNGLLCSQMFYAPTDWALYTNYADGYDIFEKRFETFRCENKECLPEELKHIEFHNSLNSFHEFYEPFFHYDKGDLRHYKHEADAKDAFANGIAVMHGCEPFKKSYANIQPMPKHYLASLGDKIYELNAGKIFQRMNEIHNESEAIEEANLIDQIKNASSAAVRVAKQRLKKKPLYISREEYDDRLNICSGCPMFDAKRIKCKHKKCGCSLKAKCWLKTEDCPLDKWKKQEKTN